MRASRLANPQSITVGPATSNITSNLGSGTFDGDICLAVAQDADLLVWKKLCHQPNARIVNPTCHWCRETCPDTCKENVNSSAPSPFPGIGARMAHRDPVAPWLDSCGDGSTDQVRRSMRQGCLLKPRNSVFYPLFTHFPPSFAHFQRLDARNPGNTAKSPGENGGKSEKIVEKRGN